MHSNENQGQLMMEDEFFANHIHALAQVDYYASRQKQSVSYAIQSQAPNSPISKHLSLLDGIAVLLVADEDIVATSLKITSDTCFLYWARNDNTFRAKESNYLYALKKLISDGTTPQKVLPRVVSYTRAKIIRRCMKLVDVMDKSRTQNLFEVDTSKAAYPKLKAQLVAAGVISPKTSLLHYLDTFGRNLAFVNKQTEDSRLIYVIEQAYILCCKETRITEVVKRNVSDRFRKLSDYLRVITQIYHQTQYLRAKGVKEIKFVAVGSQQTPRRRKAYGPTIDALNTWTSQQPNIQPITSFEDHVKPQFPEAKPGPPGIIKVSSCIHAELALATKFIEERVSNPSVGEHIEIGVSKACCYWCDLWLDSANQSLALLSTPSQVITRSTHGKRTDGWSLPKPVTIRNAFLDRFKAEFANIYDVILQGSRHDDSAPMSDSDAVMSDEEVRVDSKVRNIEHGETKPTGQFNYTFLMEKEIKVMPRTYSEFMIWVDARRRAERVSASIMGSEETDAEAQARDDGRKERVTE